MPLAVSISAQIMILPILIYYFKSISTISLFSNVILDLIISILMPLSLLCIFLNLTIPYLAYYYFKSLEFLAQQLISINQYFANLDFSNISTGSINLSFVLGYYLLIFALTIYYDYRVRKKLMK